jgi:hypothetical protein
MQVHAQAFVQLRVQAQWASPIFQRRKLTHTCHSHISISDHPLAQLGNFSDMVSW